MFFPKSRRTGSYLRDSIFAADDGLITTFAVVAGSQGGNLAAAVVLILGFANLMADGFSMASGNYQGIKTERAYDETHQIKEYSERHLFFHPLITFLGFVTAGIVPLIPYLFDMENAFGASIALVAWCLFITGCIKAYFSDKKFLRNGIENLLIGSIAATVAYFIGRMVEDYIIK